MKLYDVTRESAGFITSDYIVASSLRDIEEYFGKDTKVIALKVISDTPIIIVSAAKNATLPL
jgi:hypothetical protein